MAWIKYHTKQGKNSAHKHSYGDTTYLEFGWSSVSADGVYLSVLKGSSEEFIYNKLPHPPSDASQIRAVVECDHGTFTLTIDYKLNKDSSTDIIYRLDKSHNWFIDYIDLYYFKPNTTPTIPSSLTINTTPIKQGASFSVTRGSSTDADGDTISYKLERSVNSGAWTSVTTNMSTSYTDTALSTWNTVAYRVRAYDGTDHSGYRTSTTVSVVAPSLPSVPLSITVPDGLKGGESFTVSWGSGSGATRYYLQRSINGGSYINIYNGTTRSYSDTALASWNTIAYRVRSYNSDGYSSYRTSPTRTVLHNTAPTTPSSITVPELKSGKPATISWGSSTDSDGDTINYYLERVINSGAYTVIRSGGTTTSYSDTPDKSWNTVIYRVRAYDGTAYSSYRTSSTITVKHFPEMKLKVDGTLKTSEDGWVRVDGQLRKIDGIWIRVNGILKEV